MIARVELIIVHMIKPLLFLDIVIHAYLDKQQMQVRDIVFRLIQSLSNQSTIHLFSVDLWKDLLLMDKGVLIALLIQEPRIWTHSAQPMHVDQTKLLVMMVCVELLAHQEPKEILTVGVAQLFTFQVYLPQDVMSTRLMVTTAFAKDAYHLQEQWTVTNTVEKIAVAYMISYPLKVDVVDAHMELSQIQDKEFVLMSMSTSHLLLHPDHQFVTMCKSWITIPWNVNFANHTQELKIVIPIVLQIIVMIDKWSTMLVNANTAHREQVHQATIKNAFLILNHHHLQ